MASVEPPVTEDDPTAPLLALDGEVWRPSVIVDFNRIVGRPFAGGCLLLAWLILEPDAARLAAGAPTSLREVAASAVEHGWTILFGLEGLFVLHAAWRLLVVKLTEYRFRVATPRDAALIVRTGVLNRHDSNLELMRIRDVAVARPLWLRLARRSTIRLDTDDRSDPILDLAGIADGLRRAEWLKAAVRAHQKAFGYREGVVTRE